jgi:hypothetical protein
MSLQCTGGEECVKFARIVYGIAAAYGFGVLVPLYFLIGKIGRDTPPPITHSEFYYGFVGLALLWQVVFCMIALDPLRYRPIMPVTILEKIVFAVPVLMLFSLGRLPGSSIWPAPVDLLLGALFLAAHVRTRGLEH